MTPIYPISVTGVECFMTPYIFDAVDCCSGYQLCDKPEIASLIIHNDGMSPEAFNAMEAMKRARGLIDLLANASSRPRRVVYLSSTDVYGLTEGENIPAGTPCEPTTPFGRGKLAVEKFLKQECEKLGVALTILRAPMVIATGMAGEGRRLAEAINRGTYRHLAGDESRVSVIHGTLLARYAVVAPSGIYNVTDGDHPTRHDLAEAISCRLNHKRIYTITPATSLWGRLVNHVNTGIFGRPRPSLTFDSTDANGWNLGNTFYGFDRTPVTHYLRNHNYDESSL